MSDQFRNLLELSYAELEDLNLAAKEQRKNRVAPHVIQEERLKYLTDDAGDQGGDRAVQRPGRPAAHAGLRQEVPGEELGQPDV